jgi:hypothetical protein
MTQNKCAVLVGAQFDQQKSYGPFDSFDEASDWADRKGEPTWIYALHSPEVTNG